VFIPITAKRGCSRIIRPDNLLLLFGKFFGGGVMVSTAFIHILPNAVSTLTNECLPDFFTEGYPAFAYLITMIAALILHFLEWITVRVNITSEVEKRISGTLSTDQLQMKAPNDKESSSSEENNSQPRGHAHGHSHGHAHAHRDNEELELQREMKSTVSTIMLEAAIAVHSVIVGLALGVAKAEFVALWVALSFHQFFEGIGIGFRIADAKAYSNLAVLLTGILFSVTTPIGVGIGIGISVTTTNGSISSVLAEGILEAIAAGLLLYSALVSITVEEFGTGEFHRLRPGARVTAFIAFYLGVTAMAIIGIWA